MGLFDKAFGADAKAGDLKYDDMGYKDIYGGTPLDKEWTGLTANQISELNSAINEGKINTDSELWKSNLKQAQNQAGKQMSQGMVNLARKGLVGSGGDTTDRMSAQVESNLQNNVSQMQQEEMQRQQQTMAQLMNNYNINFNQQMQQSQMQNQINQANAQMQNQVNAANNAARAKGVDTIASGLLNKGLSDRRAKENIKFITTIDGINIYSFNYKTLPQVKFRGVMAQDLLDTKYKSLVEKDKEGYYRVDYSGLSPDIKKNVSKIFLGYYDK
jgi:hypothetical protein